MADEDLNRFLDVLKTSDLSFSLVSGLIAFAQADKNYSEVENQTVEKISQYPGLNKEQLSVLDEFTKKAVQEKPAGSFCHINIKGRDLFQENYQATAHHVIYIT